MRGRVIAVCVGPGGIPKHAVDSARLGMLGFEGDRQRFRFHGGPNRAVCLFSIEDYGLLQRDGVVCEPPGAFGENVLTEGLDYRALRPDDELVIGDPEALDAWFARAATAGDDASRAAETVGGGETCGDDAPTTVVGDSKRPAAAGGTAETAAGGATPAGGAVRGDDRATPVDLDVVRIAIHDVREPCKTLKSVDARFPNLMLGRSGFVCRVIQGGVVRPGMQVRRASSAPGA